MTAKAEAGALQPLRISIDRLRLRLQEGQALAVSLSVDALVLFAGPRRVGGGNQTSGNVQYFTGWTPMGSAAMLVIPARGEPVVLTVGPNDTRVMVQRTAGLMAVRRAQGLPGFAPEIGRIFADCGAGPRPRIALAGAAEMPAPLHAGVAALGAVIACDREIHALRLVRHADEIALHAEAAAISDAMIAVAMARAVEPGVTPARLMADVEHAGRLHGADLAGLWLATGPAPPVTCFEFFELPPSLEPGDRVQLGTTLSYEGHFAQGLRMGVRGRPPAGLEAAAALLIAMQDAALAALVPGRPVSDLVDTLEDLIDAHCPYERASDPFRFQSCHGLGLNYAEPALADALSPARDPSRDGERPLIAENMVFEIHPNFTLPGLGHVSAGDVAVVTARGARWLTHYPRGLVRLD